MGVLTQMEFVDQVRETCRKNGGKWRGFRIGSENTLLVRIRRKATKHFFLQVENCLGFDTVVVNDIFNKESGKTAKRYDEESFIF